MNQSITSARPLQPPSLPSPPCPPLTQVHSHLHPTLDPHLSDLLLLLVLLSPSPSPLEASTAFSTCRHKPLSYPHSSIDAPHSPTREEYPIPTLFLVPPFPPPLPLHPDLDPHPDPPHPQPPSNNPHTPSPLCPARPSSTAQPS